MKATQYKSTLSVNQDVLEKWNSFRERILSQKKKNEVLGKQIKKEEGGKETGRGQKNEGKEDQVIKWQRKRKRKRRRKRKSEDKAEEKEEEERRERETGGGKKEEEERKRKINKWRRERGS